MDMDRGGGGVRGALAPPLLSGKKIKLNKENKIAKKKQTTFISSLRTIASHVNCGI